MYFRPNIGEKSLGILNFGLRLCKSYEMMLDYRFKFILIMVNELLCGWANIDMDWEGSVCPNSKNRIV